jgi:hypothetical protein
VAHANNAGPVNGVPLPVRRRLLAAALAWAGPACLVQAQPRAPGPQAPEYHVKGAFLFKFGEFVDWPSAALAGPDVPFTIAVLGADPVADVLEELSRQRKVNGRTASVQRLRRSDPAPAAHIVFAGAAEAERLQAWADQLRASHTLTVTETAGASQPPGMINFVIRDNRVRFEVDADAVDAAGLKISSKVLSLAVNITGRQGQR